MTPSPKEASTKPERSALTNLVLLQDLDLMIRDATDPAQTEDLAKMGFKTEGLESLKGARDELAAGIDARVLKAYDTAAKRYSGRAVVPVKDKVCMGCWALQPTGFETAADRIANCQSCGRILYPL